MKSAHNIVICFFILYLNISKGPPVIQFPGRAQPPTSFGSSPGAPSAPGAPSYSPMSFSNTPPISFGTPQSYSQAPTPYPTQPMHPTPNILTHTSTYPLQQASYPSSSMPMPMPCYPPNVDPNQSVNFSYPQQQNYNVYPNLQKAPEAREYFSNIAPSPCPPGSNVHMANSISYYGGNYSGGQGVGSTYSYTANPPTATSRDAAPAPRKDRFISKVRKLTVV